MTKWLVASPPPLLASEVTMLLRSYTISCHMINVGRTPNPITRLDRPLYDHKSGPPVDG
jgi:hypothetical protein